MTSQNTISFLSEGISFELEHLDVIHKNIVETTYLFAYMFDEEMLCHWEAVRDIGKETK